MSQRAVAVDIGSHTVKVMGVKVGKHGLAITRFGNYTWMWWADIALASVAALLNLPIREARMQPAAQVA